jgi:hypothetical protein
MLRIWFALACGLLASGAYGNDFERGDEAAKQRQFPVGVSS